MRQAGSILRAVFCAFLLAACTACADIPLFGDLFGPSVPNPAAQMPALERHIYILVQDQRRKLDPKSAILALDPELVAIARKRSAEMALKNSFTAEDKHASATMLMAADAKFQGLVGENVAAQHFNLQTPVDPTAFAQRFVDGWLASQPHKDNLSFAEYNHTGVGAAVNGNTIYVTQLFSTDLGMPQGASAPAPQVKAVASPQQGKDDSEEVPLRGGIMPSGAR